MYTEILQQSGLSEKEAQVYEKLLELGPSSVGKLIKVLPYKRGDLYNILYSLRDKGLLIEELKKGVMTFTLESPEKLKDLVVSEKEKLEQKEKAIADAFPHLKSLYNLSMNKPSVRFFEGKEGIIQAYELLLANGENIDSFEDKGEMAHFIPEYSRKYPRRRVKHGIFNRVIAPADNPINESNLELMRETRLVPTCRFPFRMDVKISGKLVSLVSFQKESPVAILIENQEIAENYRMLFELVWDSLKCADKPNSNQAIAA